MSIDRCLSSWLWLLNTIPHNNQKLAIGPPRTTLLNYFLLCFLAERLTDVPGVSSLHEVHVWELAGGKNIATLHVKCQTTSDYQDASYKMREVFHEAGIHSVTIQPEYIDHKTSELICSSPCISKACASQLCCPQQEVELTHDNGYPEKNGLPATLHKDNSLNKNGVEIPIEHILAGDGIKNTDNCKKSDGKSYPHSTHF